MPYLGARHPPGLLDQSSDIPHVAWACNPPSPQCAWQGHCYLKHPKMFRRSLLLAALLLLSSPSLAATALESVRSGATSARERVSSLRSRQMALRQELNGVAGRIEALKTERKGKVLGSPELEQALRRSQELSGALTDLAQAVASADGDAQKQNLALLTALSAELVQLRGRFDAATDRPARRALLDRMKALRSEREQVRAALPAAVLPALEAARPTDEQGEDVDDLLEQADFARDNEDKVRRELAAIDARIREVREERELDRHMSDFLSDDLFDEAERGIRTKIPKVTGAAKSAATDDTLASRAGDSREGVGAPAPVPPTSGANGQPPAEPQFQTPVPAAASKPGAVGQPVLGQGRDLQLTAQELDDLGALNAQKKRLEGMADSLRKRAEQLESRARQLR